MDNVTVSQAQLVLELEKEALSQALKTKQTLCQFGLNLVTAESLTSGMIASTLTSIPGMGGHLYGGFVVYDTDAKRKWLEVQTKGVYSRETAREMAIGALNNSRAMVSVAVTGNAMPTPDNLDMQGVVDIAVCLRVGGDKHHRKSKRVSLCKMSKLSDMCQLWKESQNQNMYAPLHLTQILLKGIRLATTTSALAFLVDSLNKWKEKINQISKPLKLEKYDGTFSACGEPSKVIRNWLDRDVTDDSGDCKEGSNEFSDEN